MGQVYFRVSKHLNCSPIEVMQKKFLPTYKFLIMYYSEEIRQEQKQAEELEEMKKK